MTARPIPFPYRPFGRECVSGKSLAVCTCSACMADEDVEMNHG